MVLVGAQVVSHSFSDSFLAIKRYTEIRWVLLQTLSAALCKDQVMPSAEHVNNQQSEAEEAQV